jgi:hypothetical protein
MSQAGTPYCMGIDYIDYITGAIGTQCFIWLQCSTAIDYVPGIKMANARRRHSVLCALSSVIAKSGHTFPSPVARSVSVTVSDSIAHMRVLPILVT